MTTAHRPTWAPARGGEEQGGARLFVNSRVMRAKDLASELKLKFRQDGQGSVAELAAKDLKAELEGRERKHKLESQGLSFEDKKRQDLELLEAPPSDEGGTVRELIPRAQDADDPDDDASSSSSDDDDEEDDEEMLKAELERIRRERAIEAEKKAAEEAKREAAEREAAVRTGNPLLGLAKDGGGGDVDFGIKRRWDDDVVFKNQTRGEVKAPRRFINDTVRSDFHRRFLERYVR